MKSHLLATCCLALLALSPAAVMAQTSQGQIPPGPTPPLAPQGQTVTPGISCQVRCGFDKTMVEGQPIDSRPTQLPTDHPLFPGQTRAPYHKTGAVKVTTLASDLDNPWAVAQLPSGRFLVTEKPGRIRILNKDGTPYETLTDLPPIYYRGQVGMLDLVLDPHYSSNHRIFFTFMHKTDADNCAMAIGSAILNETKGQLSDVKTIFETAPYANRTAGNAGSRLAFAKDGTLFDIIGDRSGGDPVWNAAQLTDNYLGKLVHVTVDGKPVASNPKLGLPAIYNIGHRSEQGLTYAPDGKLWEVEDGPRGGDHISIMEAGKNYGWPLFTHGINYPGKLIGEGAVEAPGTEQPVYYWDPAIAPSGLAFYKGNLFPQWKNSLFVGSLAASMLIRLEMKNDKVVNEEPLLTDLNKRIRDVRVFNDGAVYVLTDGPKAQLLKLTPG